MGDLLLKEGVISEHQLELALEEQRTTGMRLGEILLKNGFLNERQLAEALSKQLHLPFVSLARYRPMQEALNAVPESVAKRLEVVPLAVLENNRLKVAVADPLNLIALDELRLITSMELDLAVATHSDIARYLEGFYHMQGNLESALVEVVDEDSGSLELDMERLESQASADDAPVVKLVNNILEQAVKEGASDVHIEPFEKSTRVRYRVDGLLFDALDFPRNLHPPVSSRLKIMANMDISEKRKPQDGRILLRIADRRIDLRISSLPTIYGEKIVARILDQQNAMVGLEKLGFSPEERSLINDIITAPHGIILVTGPTGSGKSTTLYSVLDKLNNKDVNIITVEDPVEYTIPGINQVQINEKAGLTFSETLRSILRQDPDKIMVGEIRDTETAELAIRAALTGHLVLSTLHTNDAPSAIIRLSDMGVAPFLVASSLLAVISQRLVRKLCPVCKEEYELDAPLCESLGVPEGTKIYRPVGCDECRGTGYRGRTGIYEIMLMTEEIRNLTLARTSSGDIQRQAQAEGMKTLREAGIQKVLSGETSLEEVLSVTML